MAERRAEVDHAGVGDLAALTEELIATARESSAQRASRTVISVGQMRVTMIALAAGASLADHENPGAATLHVLTGSAVLHTGSQEWAVGTGSLTQIPDERHGLRAEADTVVLLTVALSP